MAVEDQALISALTGFAERARAETSAAGLSVDFWLRTDHPARDLVELLEQDAVIARASAKGVMMRLPPHVGFPAGTWQWVLGYLQECVERGADPEYEAQRLIRFLRMKDGAVPARVRASLFGFAVDAQVELPFGRLMPASRRDLAIPEIQDLPSATVFEAVMDVPARMTYESNDMGWSIEDGERLETDIYARFDEVGLARLLICLVFCLPDDPIQEHVVAIGPFFSDQRVGLNAVPLASIFATASRRSRTPMLDIGELKEVASVVAQLHDAQRIGVAARRYFQALAERARPADAIVDFATAIEALAGTSHGKAQGRWIKDALGSDPLWSYRIEAEFKELNDARNAILHRGATPPGARAMVLWMRSMISHAIMATVLRETGATPSGALDPNRPKWPPDGPARTSSRTPT